MLTCPCLDDLADALDGSIVLLGTVEGQPTIVSLQKTAFDVEKASTVAQSFAKLQSLGVRLLSSMFDSIDVMTDSTTMSTIGSWAGSRQKEAMPTQRSMSSRRRQRWCGVCSFLTVLAGY